MSRSVEEVARKIASMEIRGAARIAQSAARALRDFALSYRGNSAEEFLSELHKAGEVLKGARPTAVSLPNAVNYVLLAAGGKDEVEEIRSAVVEAAERFIARSKRALERIGEIGARRIKSGDVVLTHCNSQAALSVITTAFRQGKEVQVIATESRPRYQGHLTARQLAEQGIPVTLIVDSAVRTFMKEVDKVIVGADSIAANGAVINKIGTSQIALAAHEARVVFMVAAETYKFHPATVIGALVEIEERPPSEVAPPEEFPGVEIRNPAFDVTPPEYIDLIITERGVIPPQAAIMVLREEFGFALEE
ncbi:MAG: ribose 1,5-bisphosphate isomerase [Euryarchaeota archaeon]|nr:ribose 1,5-bisphosphate isomerase [Euryarchaeota archaeon]